MSDRCMALLDEQPGVDEFFNRCPQRAMTRLWFWFTDGDGRARHHMNLCATHVRRWRRWHATNN